MNGKIVDWPDANIHIASHVIHYGSAVSKGLRCYRPSSGSAFFRLDAHMRRLYDSARIYRWTTGSTARLDAGRRRDRAGQWPRRMLNPSGALSRLSHARDQPLPCPCGGDDIVCSGKRTWARNALEPGRGRLRQLLDPQRAEHVSGDGQVRGNYANSSLIKMEAVLGGYTEGIALDATAAE